jgi:uncharacterized protein (DUF305 family)
VAVMRSVTASIVAIAAAGAAAVLLVACGGSPNNEHSAHSSSATAAPSEVATHNADDVTFAQGMIPHHEQAVEMAQIAQGNTTNPDVLALANQVLTAQLPEIQIFRAWLAQWDQPAEAGHQGMSGMAGMVDQATMDKLRAARGADFDKLWLESMIAHHQGAITMAQQEIAHGKNQDTISVANTIIATQQGEIDKMKQLLGG